MNLSGSKPRSNEKKRQRKQQKQARKINRLKKLRRVVRKKGFKQSNKLQRRLRKERKNIYALSKKMQECLGRQEIDALAKESKFLIRASKILPLAFVITLSYGLFGEGGKSLNLLASNMFNWFGIQVSAQALCDRLKNKTTLNFLKKVFIKVLNFQLSNSFESKYAKLFKHFSAVKIEDSTSFELHEHNEGRFKGSGGCASSSAMKLNTCYDLKNNTIANIEICSGTFSDQKLANKLWKTFKKKELLIRDLGYFNLQAILTMISSGIYFISRLQMGTNIFLDEKSEKPDDMFEFLKNNTENGQIIDRDLYIGECKAPVRFIAYTAPEEVQEKRIKRIKKVKKITPTQDYITWCGYSVFITNIPREIFAAETILEIYKIRWQIELFFKTLKQTLKIDVIRTKDYNSTECMIYAKLISLVMANLVISYTESICEKQEQVSFDKAMKWLHNDNRFGIATATNALEELLETMILELKMIFKDSRIKEQSSYRCVEECIKNQEAA